MKESPRATARTVSSRELYLRLLRYVAPYRHVFLVAILGAILVALTEAALAVAASRVPLDRSRIFATGKSDGGGMAVFLARRNLRIMQ